MSLPALGPLPTGAKPAAADSLDTAAPAGAIPMTTTMAAAPSLQMMPQPVAPQPRTAKSTHASLLDIGGAMGAMGRLTGMLFGAQKAKPAASETFARHPALAVLAQQTERVRRIGAQETALMAQAQNEVADGVRIIRGTLHVTGIDPDQFLQKYDSAHGIGGPDIPLTSVPLEGIADPAFQSAYYRASAVLGQITDYLHAMRSVPMGVGSGERARLRAHQRLRARASTPSPAAMPSIPASTSQGRGARSCARPRRGASSGPGRKAATVTLSEIDHGVRNSHALRTSVRDSGACRCYGDERLSRRKTRIDGAQHRAACALRGLVRRRRPQSEQIHRGWPPCSPVRVRKPLPPPPSAEHASRRRRQASAALVLGAVDHQRRPDRPRGTLISTGDIQVDGKVEGNVNSTGLVIGEKAFIQGDVAAEDVTVRGRVKGAIRARKVLLAATCHVEGDILHEAFAVETGAFFEGNCRHADNPLAQEAVRVAAPAAAPQSAAAPAAGVASIPPRPQRRAAASEHGPLSPRSRRAPETAAFDEPSPARRRPRRGFGLWRRVCLDFHTDIYITI